VTQPDDEHTARHARAEPTARADLVISADRLGDIATPELDQLAGQFHDLTVRMYDELCLRRSAEHGVAEIEAMLKRDGRSP
jgi:hypothetical protein